MLAGLLTTLALVAPTLAAQTTSRVSVTTAEQQGNSRSTAPAVSADGRYVAFESDATNLAAGTVGRQVYVRDRVAGTTSAVSVSSSGAVGYSGSKDPSLSADGRFIAFGSSASNLVPGDTNGELDVFVHDRTTRTTRRVSVSSSGTQGNDQSLDPAISADGHWVVFQSFASNFVLGDTNGVADVFRYNLDSGLISIVSKLLGGGLANGASRAPSVSGNGNRIAFESDATNLVNYDTNGVKDVFVRHSDGRMERVSLTMVGDQPDAASHQSVISADGRAVAFRTQATNMYFKDTGGRNHVYHVNLDAGFYPNPPLARRLTLVSEGLGAQVETANGETTEPSISADGRWVAYSSTATNLIPADPNGAIHDVYVTDIYTPFSEYHRVLVSVAGTTGANSISSSPAISGDGKLVAFASFASNLVGGDTTTDWDVFAQTIN
jgi:Tol biopolymer transport system component